MPLKQFVLLLIIGSACGGPNPIEGTWQTRVGSCYLSIAFNADSYSSIFGCTFTNGRLGGYAEEGKYLAENGLLSTTSTHSTCANDTRKDDAVRYTLSQNNQQLTILASDGTVLLFERFRTSGPSQGAIQLGCFDDDGVFTPGGLRELPPPSATP